jgi:hypothetical protein
LLLVIVPARPSIENGPRDHTLQMLVPILLHLSPRKDVKLPQLARRQGTILRNSTPGYSPHGLSQKKASPAALGKCWRGLCSCGILKAGADGRIAARLR